MLKRRLKLLFKVMLALIVSLLACLLFERIRGQISLATYKRKLVAQGEKLKPGDFSRAVLDAENGAADAIKAIERLERGAVLPMSPPPRMKLTPTGRAIVGFRESEWVEKGTYRNGEWINEKVTNHWDQMAADLKANEATLAEIRAALAKPVLNNKLDLSEGMKMKFLHLAPSKSLTYWLGAGSGLAFHEGRNNDAIESLLVQVRLPRLLAEDHIVISELVRIAIGAIAKVDTWEALQAEDWTDGKLAALLKAWEEQEFVNAMARSLEGERVFGDASAEMMRRSHQAAVDVLFGLERVFEGDDSERPAWERGVRSLPVGEEVADFLKVQVYARVWRFAWSHQDQHHALVNMQVLLQIMRDAATHKSYIKALPELDQFGQAISNNNIYDKLRFPSSQLSLVTLSRCLNRAMRAETDRSLALCAIALKRYSLRHGKLPASLEALVPEFLVSAPIDYMDGKPVKYHLNADGGITLYSVGEDRKDDGGDAALLPDKTNLRDLLVAKGFCLAGAGAA